MLFINGIPEFQEKLWRAGNLAGFEGYTFRFYRTWNSANVALW